MVTLSFVPDKARAVAIDQRMRHELATSLEYIRSEIRQQSDDPDLIRLLSKLDPLITLLRSDSRVSPAVFGAYYQLVFSILDNEDEITEKITKLISYAQPGNDTSIIDLSPQALGDQELVSLYQKCLDTDEAVQYGFLPPDQNDSLRAKRSIERAFGLMEKITPELAAEIKTILVEILMASAPKVPGAPRFDGASSYQLWGAMVINVDEDKSDVEMMEALAHEAGHSLLFGLTIDRPLVNNPDEQKFKSPLRRDPRPMDGIYHATFVSARMHYAMREAFNSPLLSDAQKQECEKFMAASRKAFYEGYEVVSANADLSPDGRTIIQNAYHYMQQTA